MTRTCLAPVAAILLLLSACSSSDRDVALAHAVSLPSLNPPRAGHTATPLPGGRVLLAGGCTSDGCGDMEAGRQAVIFDRRSGAFAAGPSMTSARTSHTATPLLDGRILLAGGWAAEGRPPLATVELYDPATNAFQRAGSLRAGRGGHTATRLGDGRVLIAGGFDAGNLPTETAELYDPVTGRTRPAAGLPQPRAQHAAVLLPDGDVLVAGGITGASPSAAVDSALLYDPRTNIWREAGRMGTPRCKLALAATPDGALAIGGQSRDDPAAALAGTEIYDLRTGRFRPGPDMSAPRYKISEAVVTLPDGRIVITGGGTVDVFHDGTITPLPGVSLGPRLVPAAAPLDDGTVMLTGGYDQRIHVLSDAHLLRP